MKYWYYISFSFSIVLAGVFVINGCNESNYTIANEYNLPEKVDYNFHIKPILSDRCYKCHGPDEQERKSELILHTEEGLFAKQPSGMRPIVSHNIKRSDAFQRMISDDPDLIMPPLDSKLELSEREIALVAKWIEQGAEWKEHWSFIKPQKSIIPKVEDAKWAYNDLDNFVLDELDQNDLKPSPSASKEILLRRASLDITGLPPTPEDISDFKKDSSVVAYESVIDRLLASNSYGERMAADWMDVARYADTHGYLDDTHREVWHWRDWVIDAFNDNLSYDEFITWQLAGDLIPDGTKKQKLATGFNRLHRQNQEGGVIPEEYRVEYVADRVSTTSKAFMGITMECARCHDHKYDPISQKDFYQMAAFFNSSFETGRAPIGYESGPTMMLLDNVTDHKIDSLKQLITGLESKIQNVAYDKNDIVEWVREISKDGNWKKEVDKSLTGHYSFESLSDNKFSNSVNPVQVAHAISWKPNYEVVGVKGKGISFDESNAVFFGKEIGDFDRTDAFSISVWVNLSEKYEDASILDNCDYKWHAYRGYELRIDNGKLSFRMSHNYPQNAIRVDSKVELPIEEWIKITFTYDGSSRGDGVLLYLNGKKIETDIVYDNLHKSIQHDYDNDMVVMPYFGLKVGSRMNDPTLLGGMLDEFKIYNRKLSEIEVGLLVGSDNGEDIDDFSDAQHQEWYRISKKEDTDQKLLKKLRDQENKMITKIPEVMVMGDEENRTPTYVLNRGLYDQKSDEVFHNVPSEILDLGEEVENSRLGLARWITHPDHPLTARVAVNRIWQMLFGQGLVTTPDDFGNQGALPSHPELLDWLAVDFIENGWDVKKLIKKIMLSHTYQQSSDSDADKVERDPKNVFLARGPRYRLPAEMIRDQALASGGLLTPTVGGPSVKPYQPEGLWAEQAFQAWAHYEQSTGSDLYRRTLYTYWKRNTPHPFLTTFDIADRASCTVKRNITSTPTQSLMLLNYPLFHESARVLAEKTIANKKLESSNDQLNYIFQSLTGREPSEKEKDQIKKFYQSEKERFADDPKNTQVYLEIGEYRSANRYNISDLAALSSVGHSIMNTVNFYMKI